MLNAQATSPSVSTFATGLGQPLNQGAGVCTHASHLTVLRAPVGTLGATFLAVFWIFLVACRSSSGQRPLPVPSHSQLLLTKLACRSTSETYCRWLLKRSRTGLPIQCRAKQQKDKHDQGCVVLWRLTLPARCLSAALPGPTEFLPRNSVIWLPQDSVTFCAAPFMTTREPLLACMPRTRCQLNQSAAVPRSCNQMCPVGMQASERG